tara:strand:+ start:5705 stop:6721 length:1017 start_codon:yes stop_codon:yes gene_type:complete
MYHKRIVVDFDDTLAFHQNRDFNKALPNTPLIEKLNGLYDQGWQIDIFTARGSISCNTREEARQKYEASMIEWLNKNNVKFNALSFDKPLAAYYIDDKGIMPEDFLEVNIRELEGGLSGTDIYTDGKVVHKQDANAHLTKQWFNKAVGIKTPNIHRIVGETITMDYIDHDESYFENNFHMALGIIQTKLEIMKNLDNDRFNTFQDYRDRIRDHATNSGQELLVEVANELNTIDLNPSFAHGDFGIKNMLFKDCNMVLIDPICNTFGCTELDAAKFCASLIINQYNQTHIKKSIDYMALANGINTNVLRTLIKSEITRVYKYHPDKNFIMECVKYVYQH